MENKEITITPPEGYEVDKEKSTFEKIVFKSIVPDFKTHDLRRDTNSPENWRINNLWAFTLLDSAYNNRHEGNYAAKYKGYAACGRALPVIFLADCNGIWYDENGNIIHGYLFYKPQAL